MDIRYYLDATLEGTVLQMHFLDAPSSKDALVDGTHKFL